MYNYLDNDLYKFTTSYAYMKLFPHAEGTFEFTDRDGYKYSKDEVKLIKLCIKELSEGNRLTYADINWLNSNIRFIPSYYWEWLQNFKFDTSRVEIVCNNGELHISVTDKLYKVTLYEVPILAVVSEVRGKELTDKELEDVLQRTRAKAAFADRHGLRFSEFGTRRRHSFNTHLNVVRVLSNYQSCVGTSNVLFAKVFGMKPMGTHPHEWFMFHGAQFGYKIANYLALENWQTVYDGDLGIALSDTYTIDAFLNNFSKKLAKLYDGVRQDSGDPILFVDKVCDRYRQLGIDPQTKSIVFSNALGMERFQIIANYCKGKINCSAGIGTNLTFDIPNQKAPNIVMKLTKCRMSQTQEWRDCIKISDDPGKAMGNPKEIEICKCELNING